MTRHLFIPLTLALVIGFLIGPFLIIVAASFSAGDTLAFPPQGFSLQWILKVFTVESFRASFAMSMFLAIGGTLVFTGCLTAYITPAILGGSKVLMLETLMYQQVAVSNNFVAASVIACILIVMSFAANLLLKRVATARNTQRRAAR